jgi:hypothetical protein
MIRWKVLVKRDINQALNINNHLNNNSNRSDPSNPNDNKYLRTYIS